MSKPKRPRKKLSADDIIRICRLYSTGSYSQGKLAKMYRVGASYVGQIVRGEVRHEVPRQAIREDLDPAPLTPEDLQVKDVHDLIAEGYTPTDINSALDLIEGTIEVPHVPLPVTPYRDLTEEETLDAEYELDNELVKQDQAQTRILELAAKFEREQDKQLAEKIKVDSPSRRGKRSVEKVELPAKTLDELEELENGNKYIRLARETPELELVIRQILTGLPPDIWDSPVPGILIEKAIKAGEVKDD